MSSPDGLDDPPSLQELQACLIAVMLALTNRIPAAVVGIPLDSGRALVVLATPVGLAFRSMARPR